MIQKYVTSFELSKQLYEAEIGIDSKTKSVFVWAFTTVFGTGEWMLQHRESWEGSKATMRTIPAYLSSELGELLPTGCTMDRPRLLDGQWRVIYYLATGHRRQFLADTEANARAKCLLYLKEKGLL